MLPKITLFSLLLVSTLLLGAGCLNQASTNTNATNTNATAVISEEKTYLGDTIALPAPSQDSATSVEAAMQNRRSIREYADQPVTLAHVGQMLWAAQGITSESGGRTAPSARSLYPLEVYLVAKNVTGLEKGLYHYIPDGHKLGILKQEDLDANVEEAGVQAQVKEAKAVIIITGNYEKMREKFGDASEKMVHQESGHVGQNLYLQAESLSLGMVVMGGFDAEKTTTFLDSPLNEIPQYMIPFGTKKTE